MLNTYYIGNGTTCIYCDDWNQATCSNSCNSSVTPISNTYASMIENVVWSTRGIGEGIYTTKEMYEAEQTSELTGKECSATNSDGSANEYCTDTVTRKTEWEGKIGLIYPSDWGYAGGSTCTNIMENSCVQNNWLNTGIWYCTISPSAYSHNANIVWHVGAGIGGDDAASDGNGVRVSLYLKSNVQIIDGDGSKNNPYKLK